MSTATAEINLAKVSYHPACKADFPDNKFGIMKKDFYVLEGDIRTLYHAHVGDGPLGGRWTNYTYAQILVDYRREMTGEFTDDGENLRKKILYANLQTPYNAWSNFTIVVEAAPELAFIGEGRTAFWESTWVQ